MNTVSKHLTKIFETSKQSLFLNILHNVKKQTEFKRVYSSGLLNQNCNV